MKRRTQFRFAIAILGAADILGYALGTHTSTIVLSIGLVILFLAATDFGRQCPLILSMRNVLRTVGSKGRIKVEYLRDSHDSPGDDGSGLSR